MLKLPSLKWNVKLSMFEIQCKVAMFQVGEKLAIKVTV